SCVYCDPKSRMRIFSACRSATWALRRGGRTVTRHTRARTPRLSGQDLQPGLGAVQILLGLSAGHADGAEDGPVAADQRRAQTRDDGDADQLRDGVEEARPLLVDLRQRGAVPMPESRTHRLGLGDLRGEGRCAVHARERKEQASFVRLNRNKRSLALDLKAPRGKDVFRQLVRRCDVVVENLRPGTMKDLELDYPRLAQLNPGLVYVAASGWGQDGPYAQRPGLDIM